MKRFRMITVLALALVPSFSWAGPTAAEAIRNYLFGRMFSKRYYIRDMIEDPHLTGDERYRVTVFLGHPELADEQVELLVVNKPGQDIRVFLYIRDFRR
jgi:hypothetical protein